MVVYHNQPRFKHKLFKDDRVQRKSTLSRIRSHVSTSYWTEGYVNKNLVSDSTSLLQLGYNDDTEFESISIGAKHANSFNVWPTKENRANYRFNTIWLELSQDLTTIERQTYSLLEWLGDVGGLFDGLVLFANYLIAPFVSFYMQSVLFSQLLGKNEDSQHDQSCCKRKRSRKIAKMKSSILA